jgi:hypothetical protein
VKTAAEPRSADSSTRSQQAGRCSENGEARSSREVAAYRLVTPDSYGSAVADWLTLEVHVGVEFNANVVIGIDPDAEHTICGSDLHAEISLSGANPD